MQHLVKCWLRAIRKLCIEYVNLDSRKTHERERGLKVEQGHASQRKGVAYKFTHSVADSERGSPRQVVMDLEQVGLYVAEGRVKDKISVRTARHFGDVLVPVDDLRNENYFVL